MSSRVRTFVAGLLALTLVVAAPVVAQSAGGPAYSQDELDQLLAPIALYPDQLLSQVLMASTYPLEVVEAARFVQQNPNLGGDALDQALADKNWDPSVQSLAAFPQILTMMNDQIEWTQRVGDAFLADQQRVMDTVQSLRQRAQAQGNLQSTPQQSVIYQDNAILIEPAQPDSVYVPVYNPLVIYGPWWAPDYPPWFWYPPAIYGYPGIYPTIIVFGRPCRIYFHHWGWAYPDWRQRHIVLNTGDNRFWNRPDRPPPVAGATWAHTPEHRRGVAYPDPATRDRFVSVDPSAVRARQGFRGRDFTPPGPNVGPPGPGAGAPSRSVIQPAPSRPQTLPTYSRPTTPAFDPGLSRQQTQMNAERGFQSRQSIAPVSQPRGGVPSGAPVPRGNGSGGNARGGGSGGGGGHPR